MRLILLSLVVASGCFSSTADQDTTDYHAIAASFLAAAVIQPDEEDVSPQPSPSPQPGKCEHCQGRGYIIQGDGHRTTCPHCTPGDAPEQIVAPEGCRCADCTCDPCECEVGDDVTEVVAVERVRVLHFGAAWCAPCKGNERSFAAMRTTGWNVGPGADNHIQTIDIDTPEGRALAAKYRITAVPTFIVVRGDQEVARKGGYLNPFQIGDLYYGG